MLAGYDIGSRIAQAIARQSPERVRALVVTPPMPGAGQRLLDPGVLPEFWYQNFHRLDLSEPAPGRRPGRRPHATCEHFWTHWSGPSYTPADADLDRLADSYGRPGAFTSSIGWYRVGPGILVRGLAEQAPAPDGAARRPHATSSGRRTTRCSRPPGATASTSSSPTSR